MTSACGRAIATIMSVSASRNSTGGMWRRRRWPAPIASLTMREARIAHRELLLPAQEPPVREHEERHGREQPQQLGPEERHAAPMCCGKPPPAASWLRRLRKSAKRRIASTRSSSVASSSASTPACRKAVRNSASRCLRELGEALAEALVVGVDEDLLAGLGVLDDEQPEVGQLHLQRIVEAHRDHLVARREMGERLAPAGTADEVGNDEYQRAALDDIVRRAQEIVEVGSGSTAWPPAASACGAGCAARGAGRCARGSPRRLRCRRTARRRDCRGA